MSQSGQTYSTKASDIHRQWHVIDAQGKILGRVATEVAQLLKGKHKPLYVTHLDTGDYVIVINAAKIVVTGKKLQDKLYYRHSGYPGGLKVNSLGRILKARPTWPLEHAIRGMLPRNRLGTAMFKKLKIYPEASHPHQAQVGVAEKKEA